jgi:hypothetical protein
MKVIAAWTLAAVILALASTSVFYARTLSLERARTAALERAAAQAAPAFVSPALASPVQPAQRRESASFISARAAPGVIESQAGNGLDVKRNAVTRRAEDPAAIPVARFRLEQFRDPAARAVHRRQQERRLRGMLGGSFEPVPGTTIAGMGLSAAEIDVVAGPLLEAMDTLRERQLECDAEPACDIDTVRTEIDRTLEQEFAARVGAERFAKFRQMIVGGMLP